MECDLIDVAVHSTASSMTSFFFPTHHPLIAPTVAACRSALSSLHFSVCCSRVCTFLWIRAGGFAFSQSPHLQTLSHLVADLGDCAHFEKVQTRKKGFLITPYMATGPPAIAAPTAKKTLAGAARHTRPGSSRRPACLRKRSASKEVAESGIKTPPRRRRAARYRRLDGRRLLRLQLSARSKARRACTEKM